MNDPSFRNLWLVRGRQPVTDARNLNLGFLERNMFEKQVSARSGIMW